MIPCTTAAAGIIPFADADAAAAFDSLLAAVTAAIAAGEVANGVGLVLIAGTSSFQGEPRQQRGGTLAPCHATTDAVCSVSAMAGALRRGIAAAAAIAVMHENLVPDTTATSAAAAAAAAAIAAVDTSEVALIQQALVIAATAAAALCRVLATCAAAAGWRVQRLAAHIGIAAALPTAGAPLHEALVVEGASAAAAAAAGRVQLRTARIAVAGAPTIAGAAFAAAATANTLCSTLPRAAAAVADGHIHRLTAANADAAAAADWCTRLLTTTVAAAAAWCAWLLITTDTAAAPLFVCAPDSVLVGSRCLIATALLPGGGERVHAAAAALCRSDGGAGCTTRWIDGCY